LRNQDLVDGRGKNFLLQSIQTSFCAHPSSHSVGTGGSCAGVNQLGHEAGYSPRLKMCEVTSPLEITKMYIPFPVFTKGGNMFQCIFAIFLLTVI
jgi:hypothetical protein